MEDLLKKLDEKMTSELVRKLGGLFCFTLLALSLAGFIFGAGALMKSPEQAVVEDAEGGAEEADAEAGDEESEEEAVEEEVTEDAEEESEEAVEEEEAEEHSH